MGKDLQSLPDGELISKVFAGDRAGFHEIIRRYLALVLAALRLRGLNREDSVEITGETFVRSFTALGELRGPGALGARLHEISASEAINFHHRRRPTTVYRVEKERAPRTPREQAKRLLASASRIPGDYRDIFFQKHLARQSCQAIARRTGLTQGSTVSRLQHAHELLDAELGHVHGPVDDECLELRQSLILRAAQEDPPAQEGAVRNHLQHCGPCQAEESRVRELLALLPSLATPEPEELAQLEERILMATEVLPLPQAEMLWPTRLVWLAVLASCLALALALLGVLAAAP